MEFEEKAKRLDDENWMLKQRLDEYRRMENVWNLMQKSKKKLKHSNGETGTEDVD